MTKCEDSESIIDKIKQEVLRRVKPNEEEFAHLEDMKEEMKELVQKSAKKLGIEDVIAISVGSAERKTWLRGSHDIDIFISFPEKISREEMTESGMAIAKEVAKHADEWEDRHAEHPYLHLKKGIFEIDIVPCFRVSDASKIKSAVDRTPFHCNYIKPKISGLESEVLLLKQFMTEAGVYGADVRVSGFSGYLTEILVLTYGSFENVLKEAASWKPGVYIDMEKHGKQKFSTPLAVIDPTDPNRNVSAALSLDKFSEFSVHSRHFLKSPSIDYFFSQETKKLSEFKKEDLKKLIEDRKTYIFAIKTKRPDVSEDTIYPQLYKTEKSIGSVLEKYEFPTINSFSYANDDMCYIVIETLHLELPDVEIQRGPPVFNQINSEKFYEKYKNDPKTYNIYIKDGCYFAQTKRRFTNVKDLIVKKIFSEIAIGKDLKKCMEEEYEFMEINEILKTKELEFLKGLEYKLSFKI